MALVDKVCGSLLLALTIAVLSSCGSRGTEPQGTAGAGAPSKLATAPDRSPPRGDPAGAPPSVVVSGEVAAFRATPVGADRESNFDAARSLPSSVATGRSAPYAPEGGREPAASTAPRPAARMPRP